MKNILIYSLPRVQNGRLALVRDDSCQCQYCQSVAAAQDLFDWSFDRAD